MPSVTIKDVDLMKDANQQNSKTDEFRHPDYIVVRRGRTIDFAVKMSSSDFNAQAVQLELQRGKDPDYDRGNKFLGTCTTEPRKHYEWRMKVVKVENTVAYYQLQVPFDTPVGDYSGTVRIPAGTLPESPAYSLTIKFVFIFNPYDSGDTVYMADDSMRQEYVKNEAGLLYKPNKYPLPWNFAQFENVALDTVLYVMDVWGVTSDDRRSSAMVGRYMTAMVHDYNKYDQGIIRGNWGADYYPGGTQPTAWTGSKKILEEYMQTKKTVQWAQCWVFAGVLTTILRTLGIPARAITNYDSVHNTIGIPPEEIAKDFKAAYEKYSDRDYDVYLDENGNKTANPMGTTDEEWNFHVWTEGWMTRPDLEGNYGGWQVLDASPQEPSPHYYNGEYIYALGPASVQAIKNGLALPYDSKFVIAEVNADVTYYMRQPNGEFKYFDTDTKWAGKHISTKAMGVQKREDVTLTYKYKEGTKAERAAFGGGETPLADQSVQFSVKFSKEVYKIGDTISMEVTSTAKKALKSGPVFITVVVNHVEYTGVQMKEIKQSKKELWASGSVAVGSTASATFQVTSAEYLPDLGTERLVNFTVLCWVKSPEQSFIHVESKSLQVPGVAVQINGKATSHEQAVSLPANKSAKVVASFVNPLKTAMTNIKFHVEGSGLLSPQTFNAGTAAAGAKASVTFQITPEVRGHKKEAFLVINAESDKIKGITGAVDILIV